MSSPASLVIVRVRIAMTSLLVSTFDSAADESPESLPGRDSLF